MTISPGKYRARATEGGLGKASTGKIQIALAMSIVDGPHAGESLTYFGYFTDATTERTLESLRYLGWRGDDLSNLDGILDNEVEIVVEADEYEGKTRSKIAWINRLGGGLALKEPLADGEAKAFAARMKGAVLAQKAKAGAPRATNGKHTERRGSAAVDPLAGADFGDDDIGF